MLRLLADENIHGGIASGLLGHASVDVVRVQDLPIAGGDDEQVLAWAADNGRIILTNDRQTISALADSHQRTRLERIQRL